MTRIVVIGGGISGLAAAQALHESSLAADARNRVEIIVLERAPTLGGKAVTVRTPEWLVETGPTGFLDNEPVLDRLIQVAGLSKLPASSDAARRYVVSRGRLREVHAHPLGFAKSGILSPLGLVRLAGERFVRRPRGAVEESVWTFARRRLGRQAADRLIAPMVSGVFAGDAQRISLDAAFPRMRAMEKEHGSLFRALAARRRQHSGNVGPAGPSATLTSFPNGLSSLARALGDSGNFSVRTGTTVTGVARDGAAWRIALSDGEVISADGLVVAAEAWATAALLREAVPDLSNALQGIRCPPVAVVALGFGEEAIERVPRGFGTLIPRDEGFRILGVLWDSQIFAGRSESGTLLMRAMVGGACDAEIGGLAETEIERIALQDVMRLFALETPPVFTHTHLWRKAIPQYEIGHGQIVADANAAIEDVCAHGPPIAIAGNALGGVAFGPAAAAGWASGCRVAEHLFGSVGAWIPK